MVAGAACSSEPGGHSACVQRVEPRKVAGSPVHEGSRTRPARSDLPTLRRMRICVVYDCLFPLHGRRRRALVPQPRRAPRRRRTRGDLPDAAPVGSRRAGRDPGRARGRRRAADGALQRGRPRRIAPPLVFGAGVLWHLLRHGRRYDVVHTCLVPVLLAARGRGRCAAAALPPRRRLVRGLERARTGATTSAARRTRSGAPCSGSACACRQRAFCFSELTARAAARGGAARRGDRAARACTPAPLKPPAARAGRAARRVRRAPHPGEARAGGGRRGRAAPRERIPGCAARDPRRRARARRRARGDRRASAPRTSSQAPGFVDDRAGRARPRAARCAWCCRRAARATGSSSSRPPRCGTPAWSCATRTTPRSSSSRRASTAFVAARRRTRALADAIVRVHDGRRRRCARATADGSPRNAQRLSLDARWTPSPASYAAARARSSRASARPSAAQVNVGGLRAARRRAAARQRGVGQQPLDRRGDRARLVAGRRAARRRRRPRQRRAVRARDRDAARHRLQHRQAEALVERREHERARPARRAPRASSARDPAGQAHVAGEPELRPRASRSSASCGVG